jgi:hypothetical protein
MNSVYDANAEGHDPKDFQKARALAVNTSERIATGILYQNEEVPSFYDRLVPRQGVETTCVEEVKVMDDAIWLEIKDIVWSTVWDNVWENVTFILLENLRGKLDCVKKTVIYTI